MWVETAYLTIVRRRQMEELRMMPEDKWPDKITLADYDPVFPSDIDYYEPEDLIYRLGGWLRDQRIRNRKEQVRRSQENRKNDILNNAGVFAY